MHRTAVHKDLDVMLARLLELQAVKPDREETLLHAVARRFPGFAVDVHLGQLFARRRGDHGAQREGFALLRHELQRQEQLRVAEGQRRRADIRERLDD